MTEEIDWFGADKLEPKISITDEYREGIDFINENDSGFLFLTGRAGTGKSTFLKVLERETNKKMVKVAPTGIAALNIGGETIHSFFRFSTVMTFEAYADKKVKDKLKGVKIIVIDEISMVRADLLDRIDQSLRENMENDEPFGGKIILAIGDLYQLPPVLTRNEQEIYFANYQTPYFFGASVFKETEVVTLELTQVFRQDNQKFINFLDSVREGEVTTKAINLLNDSKVLHSMPKDFDGITLCTTNGSADTINKGNLSKLKTESHFFEASIKGEVSPSSYPTEKVLELKVGAKVLFCRNSSLWTNGETGVITEIDPENGIKVMKTKGYTVTVEVANWDYYRYEEGGTPTVAGSFSQIPLKLGWAITIHKSQGMTLTDKVIVDTGTGCFADGQFYVAVSRVTDPENLKFLKPIRERDIMVSKIVRHFMTS